MSAPAGTNEGGPRAGRMLGLFGGYAALVLALTWPLGAHLATHLPDTAIGCRFDSLVAAWVLSHLSRALAHPCWSCLVEANIYHPTPQALFYGPMALGALPYFAPPFLLTGNPALALNLTLVTGIAATATTLHLVVVRWTASAPAGLVAALAFLATRWVLWDWLPATPWFAVLACFPLAIFLAARSYVSPALAAVTTVVCLTDPVYVAPAVLAPLGLLALVRIARGATRRAGFGLLACALVAVLVVAAFHAGQIALERRQPLGVQSVWAFYVPPPDLPGEILRPLSPLAIPLAAWLLAVVAVASLARRAGTNTGTRTARLHALGWAVAGLALSLPPVIRLFGVPMRVLPVWWLVHLVPTYARLRNPLRLGVAGLFGLAILAGLGFDLCVRRLAGGRLGHRIPPRVLAPALAALVAAAIFVEYRAGLPSLRPPLPTAYPLAPAITPPSGTLGALLREPGGPLLELPLNDIRIWPAEHARAMYRSIFHGRRLLNGYTSYYPKGFPERMTLAARLPDAEAVTVIVRETGLELVLVHGEALSAADREAWAAVAAGRGDGRLRLIAREGGDLLFRAGPVASP